MIKRIDKKDKIEIKVFSAKDFWPIGVIIILSVILLYNLYQYLKLPYGSFFIVLIIGTFLFLSYIILNFFLSKSIVINKKTKRLRIRFWNINFSEIKQIHLGKIITLGNSSFAFQNIFFELNDRMIAYPGRFSPSIRGESEEIIRIIQKEIRK